MNNVANIHVFPNRKLNFHWLFKDFSLVNSKISANKIRETFIIIQLNDSTTV